MCVCVCVDNTVIMKGVDSLDWFWKEGGKGETFRHVSSGAVLVLLEESQVDPRAGEPTEH